MNEQSEQNPYTLTIIGGGPAGVSAGVYAARKQLRSALITDAFGGQSVVSDDIQNWIGFPHIKGSDLAKKMEEHLKEYAGDVLDILYPDLATQIEKTDPGIYKISTKDGKTLFSKALLLALGSKRRKLPAKNADKFEHKGLTYCASCDGPLFAGKDVVVIGGGNSGFEAAAQLLAYANSVTLLDRGEKFRADPVTVNKLLQNEKFKAINNVEVLEVLGDTFVEGLKYQDLKTNEEKELNVQGIFVEIGMIPNTEIVKDLVELDEYNRIKIDPWTQQTSAKNIWAAGDCTNVLYHQNNIASGDAVVALEDAYKHLST